MVIIERLTAPVGLEQGAAQRLNQRVCADVGIRKMDEYAGLDIARGIDVEIVASARDATADIFSVVLKIKDEQ